MVEPYLYDKIYLKGKQVVREAIMRSFYFSSPVRELLYRDGWRPNRRININHFENIISSDDGYVLDSFSRNFYVTLGTSKFIMTSTEEMAKTLQYLALI